MLSTEQILKFAMNRSWTRYNPLIDLISRGGKTEDQPVLLIGAIATLRGYAESLGLNWEELDFRASLPEADFVTLAQGKVSYFNTRHEGQKEKKFGFMADGTFFHQADGREFICDGSAEPVLGDPERREPKKYDVLIYQKIDGRKGPRAAWWAFPDTHEKALQEIEKRSTYRLRRPGMNVTLWQDKDLSKLRVLYPKDFKLTGYLVETSSDGQTWTEVDDPR